MRKTYTVSLYSADMVDIEVEADTLAEAEDLARAQLDYEWVVPTWTVSCVYPHEDEEE